MNSGGRYIFPQDRREAYESLLAPMGVYQYVGGKVVTLLVSDGLCQFQGETRETLTEHFDNRMFENVHPDDVQTLAQMAYKFAIQVGKYDTVYRSRLYGQKEYRYVHAVSKYHTMEDGSQVAFTHYADITEAVSSLVETAQNTEQRLTRFFTENASPMVIVGCRSEQLFYYNKAVCNLLKPQIPFDSGMTFQQFFYHDLPEGMPGLLNAIDMGIHLVEEPRSHKKLEVVAVSTVWDQEEACALYFYECPEKEAAPAGQVDLRHRRLAFHNIMFSGGHNDLFFWQDGYKAFRVWNLTQNTLVMDRGYNYLKLRHGEKLTYSLYLRDVLEMVPRPEDRRILQEFSPEHLSYLYETGDYPRTACFRLETSHGRVEMKTDFVLMRSPDDGNLYLKVAEENISQRVLTEALFRQSIEKEYDYMAYLDGKANTCRILSSEATSSDQWDRLISIEDYLVNFRENLGTKIFTVPEFIAYISAKCQDTREYLYTFELPNGHIKKVYIKVLDQENQIFLVHRTDITKLLKEERHRRAEMETLRDEAQLANQEKSLFLASISHDLRTPMSAILSLADFGRSECKEEACRNYFKQIAASGEYMLSMLNDILDMQKLSSGHIDLLEETVLGRTLEQRALTVVRQRAQDKGLQLLINSELPEDCLLRCDGRQVVRILVNLLNNAIKYTPSGGTITWTSRIEELSGQKWVRQEIKDTGVGMSQDFQTRMFQPFVKENNRLSGKEEGTGLGLAIVRRLVDAMQGSITVHSKLGQGSSFTVRLPYKAPTSEQRQTYEQEDLQAPPARYDFQGCRILVCEDNELNQIIIRKLLENKGFSVDLAANGLEGVAKARQAAYDAILMDVRMPILDGLEAARQIRTFQTDLPIIALSANAYAEDIKKSLAAGMNAHLAKPISPHLLFEALFKLIKRK
jgi:signal transduction histidine kinase